LLVFINVLFMALKRIPVYLLHCSVPTLVYMGGGLAQSVQRLTMGLMAVVVGSQQVTA
jgi:hypothetical protein